MDVPLDLLPIWLMFEPWLSGARIRGNADDTEAQLAVVKEFELNSRKIMPWIAYTHIMGIDIPPAASMDFNLRQAYHLLGIGDFTEYVKDGLPKGPFTGGMAPIIPWLKKNAKFVGTTYEFSGDAGQALKLPKTGSLTALFRTLRGINFPAGAVLRTTPTGLVDYLSRNPCVTPDADRLRELADAPLHNVSSGAITDGRILKEREVIEEFVEGLRNITAAGPEMKAYITKWDTRRSGSANGSERVTGTVDKRRAQWVFYTRYTGGEEVTYGDWKVMASLLTRDANDNFYGVNLSPMAESKFANYAIVAHCVPPRALSKEDLAGLDPRVLEAMAWVVKYPLPPSELAALREADKAKEKLRLKAAQLAKVEEIAKFFSKDPDQIFANEETIELLRERVASARAEKIAVAARIQEEEEELAMYRRRQEKADEEARKRKEHEDAEKKAARDRATEAAATAHALESERLAREAEREKAARDEEKERAEAERKRLTDEMHAEEDETLELMWNSDRSEACMERISSHRFFPRQASRWRDIWSSIN